MKVMVDALRDWLLTADGETLQSASSDDVARLILEFPLRNLKDVILENEMDGNRFIANPDLFAMSMRTATGWTEAECTSIGEVLFRRCSFSKEQIMSNVQRIAIKNALPQSVTTKLKERLLTDCDVEGVHFKLRVHGVMDGEYSDLVMEMLSEVMAKKELLIHDQDAFVVGYFDTVSSSLVMMADDGAHCSWICLHCGHRNVPMVVHYEMTRDISMCSLCGVLLSESIVMAIIEIANALPDGAR